MTVVAPKFLGKSSRVFASIDELVQEDSPTTHTRPAGARHDNQLNTGTGGRKFAFQLLLFFTLLGGASFAQAVQTPCSAVGGLLDGDVTPVPPANIKIDTNCRIQNYPGGLNTNFSFDNNDPTPYLAIFDNVFLTGQMSCNVVAGHKIWFTNNSSTTLSANCQSILIPVEKIDKQNPAGQTTATIGVPFTYKMVIPILFDPATGNSFIDGSVNDLGNIHITDDLSAAATGADLELLNVIAYMEGSNIPVPINNIGGNNLDFTLPDIPAGAQIIVEVTVVLRDNPVINVAGTTFVNTAKWSFSRLIDGQFFDPLPGESGITPPMTIVEPNLVVTKTSNETALNLGATATFIIDVENTGGSDVWNVTILDELPNINGPSPAGMCDYDPTAGVTAQIFAADGVTPVTGLLSQGIDYSVTYNGSPQCELSFTMLNSIAVIGATEHLVITYQSELDVSTTGDGIALTNIAGATEWFSSGDVTSRRTYSRTLSDGTPSIADHEDSHTITTTLSGYVFQKTVANLTTGANPASTAAPGDTLRYRLRLFNVDQTINNITISDLLEVASFDLTSFSMVTLPVGATFSLVAGQLDIIGNPPPLNVPVASELVIEFEITLLPALANNTLVSNQATLSADGPFIALSDDPSNGIAPPDDQDPTTVLIQTPGPLLKVNDQPNATIGEQFTYTITIPEDPVSVPLYDVRILDDLILSNADMSFVDASVVSGGTWSLSNTGTNTSLVIEDTSVGIDIPANGQAVIQITVELLNTATNNDGDPFNNSASFTYNRSNSAPLTQTAVGGSTTVDMSVVEPLLDVTKVGSIIAAPVGGGSVIEYVLSMTNNGTSTAYDVNVLDNLPAELALFTGFTPTIAGIPDTGFIPIPDTGVLPGQLIWGRDNGDGSLDIPVGSTLTLTYQAQVQVSTEATFSNTAWVEWSSLDNAAISERTGAGCPIITAPNDYCATVTSAPFTIIDNNNLTKMVIADSYIDVFSGVLDATVRIGDTATYQLRLSLGEGTTNSVTVSDVLPTGLAFDSLVSITQASGGSDFSYTIVSQPVAGATGTLVWDFGDVINTPSNDGTPNNVLVIEYIATVLPDAGIAQAPITTLTNTATLGYLDTSGLPVVDPARLVDTADLTVWQPVMTSVTKTGNGFANTVGTPLNVDVVNDILQFQLQSCNTAAPAAPAYSVRLSDVLATQLDENSIAGLTVTINGAVAVDGVGYLYTPPAVRGGTMQIELLTPVNPGQCVIVDYDIGFYNDFPPTQTWSNSTTVDEYWSLPVSSGQQYTPLVSAQFFMTNIAGAAPMSKVVSSPVSGEITIGEEVVYTITIPVDPLVVNAALSNVVVIDTLHGALEYISATAADGGGTAIVPPQFIDNTLGQNVNLTIPLIPAGEQVVITLRARLANNAAANAGVSFTNTATYTSDDLPGSVLAISGALLIVEPTVVIGKTVANSSNPGVAPNPGDILTYSLTFTASGGANFSDAFDLHIDDSLSLGLSYQAGTSSVDGTGNTINDPIVTGDGVGIAQTLVWDLATSPATTDIDVDEGTTVTVTYDVIVLGTAQPGQILSNSANAQWTGLDGINILERTGTGVPVENDYFTGPVTTTLITQSGALLKEITQGTAYKGEQFTYRIIVPDATQTTALNDVRILDDLNASLADMTFISVADGGGSATWTPVNNGDAKNLIIENTTAGIDIPAGQQAIIDITVQLDNTLTNVSGLEFNNTANYTYDVTQVPGLPDTSDAMKIIGADTMWLEKTGPATMRVGLPERFTINVQNTGTAPAWDLTVVDILPNPSPGGMCDTAPTNITAQTFRADGVTTVSPVLLQGTDYTASFSGAPSCVLTITMQSSTAVLADTDRLIITYDASLDLDNIGGTTLTNIAAATQWFSQDTAGSGATGTTITYTGTLSNGTVGTPDEQDIHSLIVESAVLVFQKTVVNRTTPALGANAQPGDTLRYTIHVENSSLVNVPDFSLIDELDALNASAMFVPGSLNIISVPVGADTSNTNPNGGANGSGLLDVRNLSLDPQGGLVDVIEVVFDATLMPVINNGTVVLNQVQLDTYGVIIGLSDDPNVNGVDDPTISGDEDPTETLIISAPAFLVEKVSTDLTGDPAILAAGDTLRYSVTVKNIGQENSVNTLLSDQIPSNTTYVANSTNLNGLAVADPAANISALAGGLLINAPENTTTGYMRADTSPTADNVATITFDVVVNSSVVDGTVISNQGFVTGEGAGGNIFPQQPSDDPGTVLADDPTLDVVGNVPVVDVLKTVVHIDVNGNTIVDTGDILRYTITASNIGTAPTTGVVLTDAVPVNTTYVGNSSSLNGITLPDPGVNVSPLTTGIDISSSDLTPPLPTAGNGTLSPAGSAVVLFDVVVDGATPVGTIISNQGFVSSNEVLTEPSDADGNDANGDQTTDVVVGNVQQLAISKQVLVVGGGGALAGGELEYIVRVTNIGSVAATNVIIIDNLDFPVAGQMTYVAGSGLLNGLPAGVSFIDPVVRAYYSATYGALPPAGVAELRFRVLLDVALNIGDTVSNTGIVNWNVPVASLSAEVSIDIGGTPGAANLNGQVWHDTNFDNVLDAGEVLLENWQVELYRNNVLFASALSDANGAFQFSGLAPNLPAGDAYEIRYIAPGAIVTTATLGQASSVFTNGPQRISDILAASGSSVQSLNLPRQPNGIVYDSVLRLPVAAAQLSMINQTRSNQLVPATCFEDQNQQNQVTTAEGYYKFDLNFSDPTQCAEGDEFEIQVQPPANGYVGTTSVIIPPVAPVTAAALDVPKCLGTTLDKIPATTQHCENSVNAVQPDPSIAPGTAGVGYNLKFLFNDVPSTDQIFNNHIPVDPELGSAVAISKVAGLLNVTRSQLVPYTITINNTLPVNLYDLNVIDNFPPGFKYVAGSSRVDNVEVEPLVNGRQLTWSNLNVGVTESRTIKLLLIVGSGVSEGEYVNTAQVINSQTNEPFSGVASATVQVIPDPTFDCTDIIGKVFDDENNNGYQDQGETGIPGVEVATARGLRITTDTHGRFHITCAVVPSEVRGSNFIMKLDDRTLPSGYRVTTENPRVQRATRGKMLKFNFGATIHRVVRLDLADGVFEKDSSELRPQWRTRIDMLIIELQKDASILRLSYLGENETESEVENRLDAIEELISDRWAELDCCYKLTIETEVFWRKGKPSERKVFE